jgi:hypothetical protein
MIETVWDWQKYLKVNSKGTTSIGLKQAAIPIKKYRIGCSMAVQPPSKLVFR